MQKTAEVTLSLYLTYYVHVESDDRDQEKELLWSAAPLPHDYRQIIFSYLFMDFFYILFDHFILFNFFITSWTVTRIRVGTFLCSNPLKICMQMGLDAL